jgi:hypothetical protein
MIMNDPPVREVEVLKGFFRLGEGKLLPLVKEILKVVRLVSGVLPIC